MSQLTSGRGVNVILDMVGGDYLERNLKALAVDGRLVQIGLQGGSRSNIDLRLVMQRRLTLTGSTLRNRSVAEKAAIARDLEKHVWPLLASGTVKPVIDRTLPLEQAAEAHRLLESGEVVGKIVLTVGGQTSGSDPGQTGSTGSDPGLTPLWHRPTADQADHNQPERGVGAREERERQVRSRRDVARQCRPEERLQGDDGARGDASGCDRRARRRRDSQHSSAGRTGDRDNPVHCQLDPRGWSADADRRQRRQELHRKCAGRPDEQIGAEELRKNPDDPVPRSAHGVDR